MQLVLVGINYKSAGITLRERLSFNPSQLSQILSDLRRTPHFEELVALSTCNRTEVYGITKDPIRARQAISEALADYADLNSVVLDPLLYTFYNKFAASHLFEVTAGLDSMVLGENEILRQIKQALSHAQELTCSGPVLNQLFRFAIAAGKRVRSETQINQGCASIGALAARLLADHNKSRRTRILVLGAGQMAQVVVKNLIKADVDLVLANRSAASRQQLADLHPGACQQIDLDQVPVYLNQVDAVIACTSAPGYLIKAQQVDSPHPLLMLDLAVPRNLDPELAKLSQVTLYDIDHLQNQVNMSLEQRRCYIAQAQTIIGEESTRFLDWFHNRDMVPTIQGLYQTFEGIRKHEIARGTHKYHEELSPVAYEVIERVTKAITQKILHHPVVRLKNADAQTQQIYQDVLSDLFGLQAEDEIDKYMILPKKASKISQSGVVTQTGLAPKGCPQ